MDTTKISTADAFAALLERQAREREDAAAALLDAEQRAANGIRNTIHPQVGAALAQALEDVEQAIREDLRADRLRVRIETTLPHFMDTTFPAPGPDDADAGRRSMIVFVPRATADGHRESLALALVDVSDAVFGRGARRRRDQLAADDQRAEAARGREVERDRQREALRR